MPPCVPRVSLNMITVVVLPCYLVYSVAFNNRTTIVRLTTEQQYIAFNNRTTILRFHLYKGY